MGSKRIRGNREFLLGPMIPISATFDADAKYSA